MALTDNMESFFLALGMASEQWPKTSLVSDSIYLSIYLLHNNNILPNSFLRACTALRTTRCIQERTVHVCEGVVPVLLCERCTGAGAADLTVPCPACAAWRV
jgi:hypothetical protein